MSHESVLLHALQFPVHADIGLGGRCARRHCAIRNFHRSPSRASPTFPWGTLVVNCTGAFAIGVVFDLVDRSIVSSDLRSFAMIGFIGESHRLHGTPLHEKIVLKARELNIARATVLRGIMGYGANSRIRTAKLLELSLDLPVVIEIVDTKERIDLLLPFLDEHSREGMVTLEPVQVLTYRHS